MQAEIQPVMLFFGGYPHWQQQHGNAGYAERQQGRPECDYCHCGRLYRQLIRDAAAIERRATL